MNDLPNELYRDLQAFIHAQDRFEFLRDWLYRCGIAAKKIEVKGYRHLLVFPPQHSFSKFEKNKVFVAHYDRVPGTPGANDNSAAVFQLLCHAGRLYQSGEHTNIPILFTDGEELVEGSRPHQQGVYQLALLLRKQGIQNCLFYVFDMCGIGDCITIGGAGRLLLRQARVDGLIPVSFYNQAIRELQEAAEQIQAFQGSKAPWVYSSFSDDLGLLLGGYAAVCFSVLPTSEVELAQQNWQEVMKNERALLSLKKGYLNPNFQNVIRQMAPKSWKTCHSSEDTIDYLEKRAFVLMENFLTFLTENK